MSHSLITKIHKCKQLQLQQKLILPINLVFLKRLPDMTAVVAKVGYTITVNS